MSKKYYVPMNQVLQMIQEELNMNLGEIKEVLGANMIEDCAYNN